MPEVAAVTGNHGAKFSAPFNDPGNLQAKALAAQENISVGEATRRLRMIHKAAQLAGRLEQRNPNSFGGMEVISTPAGIRFAAHFRGGATSKNRDNLATAAPDIEIKGSLDVTDSALSLSDLKQLGAKLLQQVRQAGVKADFGINPFTGRVSFFASDAATLKEAISHGTITPPPGYHVEQSDGIIPTATLVGGAAWNAASGQYPGCTVGFAVIQSGTTKGISTAGHCSINSPADYNATFASVYGDPGGVALTFKQEWLTNNLDVQWHTASSANTISPQFWEGSTYVTVTGADYLIAGETLCKFGRTTGKTCGPLDASWYWDSNYSGYFNRINHTSGGSLTLEGDSGGPVFSGSIAKGWIHGRDSSGNAYIMSVSQLYDQVPSLQILCAC